MKRRAWPVLFLMLLPLLACSAGGTGGTGGSGGEGGTGGLGGTGGSAPGLLPDGGYDVPDDQRAFCVDGAQAYCEMATRCGRATSVTGCLASSEGSLTQLLCTSMAALAQPSLSAGRSRFDSAAARQCVEALRSSACGTPPTFPCAGVFVGQVATGGACFEQIVGSLECHATDYCDTSMTCPGLCHPRKGAGEKSSGGLLVDDCQLGLSRTSSGYCAEPVAIGGSCVSTDGGSSVDLPSCVSGARCDYTTSRCVAKGPVGGACTAGYECRSGLVCLNGQCATRPGGGPGQPCDEPRVGNDCPVDLRCDAAPLATDGGHCTARLARGAPCSTSDDCQPGLLCRGAPSYPYDGGMGTCGGFPTIGEPCDSSTSLCLTGWCDPQSKRCAPSLAPGASCDPAHPGCDFARNQVCDPTTHACIDRKPLGASCDPAAMFICAGAAFCSEGSRTCAPMRKVGESCSGRNLTECLLGTCTNGRCASVAGLCLDPSWLQ
ncbi:MAG: hypothetical protein IPJ65_21655 [Archangiaceae bacterium]|nr:hypothetical protein [Archangiaceae bacterium]